MAMFAEDAWKERLKFCWNGVMVVRREDLVSCPNILQNGLAGTWGEGGVNLTHCLAGQSRREEIRSQQLACSGAGSSEAGRRRRVHRRRAKESEQQQSQPNIGNEVDSFDADASCIWMSGWPGEVQEANTTVFDMANTYRPWAHAHPHLHLRPRLTAVPS
jgi:hypothetical protein